MNNNTFKIPSFRLPCLRQGDLCSAPLTIFHGEPFILCCLPHLTEKEAWLLESHAKEVQKSGGTFTTLLYRNFPSTETWGRPLHEFGFPVFSDPMKRLQRSLRLLHNLSLQRCESLVFDQHHLLKFRIFHEFNFRGLSTMLTIALTGSVSPTHLSDNLRPLPPTNNTSTGLSHSHQGQSHRIEPRPNPASSTISDICA